MKTLIVIAGPTAVGKTAHAVRLARELDTEIVSCDSRQFYREMRIGVARPTDEELAAYRASADSVRVAIALTAFCELGIMECVDDRYHICVSEGKKKLADAPVLQKLGYQEV